MESYKEFHENYKKYLPKHFETELRAWVSHKIATTNLQPSEVAERLHKVAESWESINLQVRFFDKEDKE